MDPVDFMKEAPVGSVIYGFSKDPDMRIDFLVKEKSDVIQRIIDKPYFQTRSGSLIQEGVLVSVVMFCLEKEGKVFETFWNYCRHSQAGPENNIFCHMSNEGKIYFNLFGDSGEVEGVVEGQHHLQQFFLDAIQRAEAMSSWSDKAFEAAKQVVTNNYPKVEDLWNALQPK